MRQLRSILQIKEQDKIPEEERTKEITISLAKNTQG